MERKVLTSIFKVYIKLCWRGSTSPDLLQVIWLRHTCWWQHCSSSWAGSRSWPPRTHGGWFGHRAPRRCGWPPSSWHQNRSVRWTCSSVCGPAGYTLPNLPAPLTIKNFVNDVWYQLFCSYSIFVKNQIHLTWDKMAWK